MNIYFELLNNGNENSFLFKSVLVCLTFNDYIQLFYL